MREMEVELIARSRKRIERETEKAEKGRKEGVG